MARKRKNDLEWIVEFFAKAPLPEAHTALTVAKAIVTGRGPDLRTFNDLPARKRGRKPAAAVAETLGDA